MTNMTRVTVQAAHCHVHFSYAETKAFLDAMVREFEALFCHGAPIDFSKIGSRSEPMPSKAVSRLGPGK